MLKLLQTCNEYILTHAHLQNSRHISELVFDKCNRGHPLSIKIYRFVKRRARSFERTSLHIPCWVPRTNRIYTNIQQPARESHNRFRYRRARSNYSVERNLLSCVMASFTLKIYNLPYHINGDYHTQQLSTALCTIRHKLKQHHYEPQAVEPLNLARKQKALITPYLLDDNGSF